MSQSDRDSTDEECDWHWPYSVSEATLDDNEIAFIQMVSVDPSLNEICSPQIIGRIVFLNAMKCAKALLEGETGLIVDLNAPMGYVGIPPLHQLAENHFPPMVDLFLKHGAPTNLRCISEGHRNNRMLPINVALQRFCMYELMKSWTTKQSVFNLIIRLCLPEMRDGLQTVKLLASKTEGLDDEIYHYAKEGKLIELAALMLVAHEKVLSPFLLQRICSSDLAGSITLCQLITAEVTSLIAMRIRLEHSDKYQLLRTIKEKIVVMMHLLQLFEIFERAGNQLAAYLKLERPKGSRKQTSEEVAWIMEEAGFTVKHEDLDLFQYGVDMVRNFALESQSTRRELLKRCKNGKNAADLRLLEYMAQSSLQPLQPKGNGKSRRREVKNCEEDISDRYSFAARPYEQWRFSSANHLCGSHSFFVQIFETLPVVEDISSICCESGGSQCDNDMLQLSLAIERLRHHQYLKDWSYKMSIFKLLYILCLPELKKELDHIRLFASNTEKIGVLGCYYAKEGKIIELAALLMVAREKLIPQTESWKTNIIASDESMKIRKCIMSVIQILIHEEVSLMRKSQYNKSVRMCKDKRVVLSSALLLLEVFERAGDAFEKYLRSNRYDELIMHETKKEEIAYDIAWLLTELGFVLRHRDIFLKDLSCFSDKPRPEQIESLKGFLSKEIGISVYSQPHNFSPLKLVQKIGVANEHQQKLALSFPRLSPYTYNPVQLFHTFQISKGSSNVMFSSPLENQGNRELLKCHHLLSLKLTLGGKWASFVLAIRRGMKRV